MIYVTGDTHGRKDIDKLYASCFPEGQTLTREDYVIICGDFGAIWDGNENDDSRLAFYENKRYTVLFVDGNHENFDALAQYPITEWNGGKVQIIRENVIHLMRGQVYNIDGKSFFTFGGGVSIDKASRIPYISWWEQEEPSFSEINEALDNLERCNYKVDYVITHAAPQTIMRNELCQLKSMFKADCATEKFLDEVYSRLDFTMWFCGHYHLDAWIKSCKLQVLYNTIVKIAPGYPIMSRKMFE